jgi:hypothetical protein
MKSPETMSERFPARWLPRRSRTPKKKPEIRFRAPMQHFGLAR